MSQLTDILDEVEHSSGVVDLPALSRKYAMDERAMAALLAHWLPRRAAQDGRRLTVAQSQACRLPNCHARCPVGASCTVAALPKRAVSQ